MIAPSTYVMSCCAAHPAVARAEAGEPLVRFTTSRPRSASAAGSSTERVAA
jgi:hypothetical protein